MAWLQRELDEEPRGHLYARECAANAWCAIGACRLRRGEEARARAAFGEAVSRVARHPMAHAGLAIITGAALPSSSEPPPAYVVDFAVARAAVLVAKGDAPGAADVVERALASAPPGAAGWTIPIEPLLRVNDAPDAWARVLGALRMRAV